MPIAPQVQHIFNDQELLFGRKDQGPLSDNNYKTDMASDSVLFGTIGSGKSGLTNLRSPEPVIEQDSL